MPSATSASVASATGSPTRSRPPPARRPGRRCPRAHESESRTGKEARAVVLGHIQRGGPPTAFDRWLATRFGLHAIDAVADQDFGKMVALRGTDIIRVPLIEGTGELKLVSPQEYAEAQVFFG